MRNIFNALALIIIAIVSLACSEEADEQIPEPTVRITTREYSDEASATEPEDEDSENDVI